MRRESIEVTYTLRWNGVDLVVEVEGDPKHRNYDLFLVVEEQVAGNQSLHTSFLLPMTGQLTYVPESFFRAEQESIEKANSFWRDLLDHYAESEEVSPLESRGGDQLARPLHGRGAGEGRRHRPGRASRRARRVHEEAPPSAAGRRVVAVPRRAGRAQR